MIAVSTVNFPCQDMNDYQDLLQAFRTSDLILKEDSEALQWKLKNENPERQANTSVKNSLEAISAAPSTSFSGQSVKLPAQSEIKSGNKKYSHLASFKLAYKQLIYFRIQRSLHKLFFVCFP